MCDTGMETGERPSLAVSKEVADLVDDPPETLPSFLVLNEGYWHCRK